MRVGLRRLLAAEPGIQVVAEAANGADALRHIHEVQPDLLITDLGMPGLHGLELVRQVHHECPGTRIVVISMHTDEPYVAKAFHHGAMAYVCKDDLARYLLPAVSAVLAGRSFWVPPLRAEAAAP